MIAVQIFQFYTVDNFVVVSVAVEVSVIQVWLIMT